MGTWPPGGAARPAACVYSIVSGAGMYELWCKLSCWGTSAPHLCVLGGGMGEVCAERPERKRADMHRCCLRLPLGVGKGMLLQACMHTRMLLQAHMHACMSLHTSLILACQFFQATMDFSANSCLANDCMALCQGCVCTTLCLATEEECLHASHLDHEMRNPLLGH